MEKLGENMDTTDQKKEDFARLVAGANEIRDGLAVGSRFQVGLTDLDAGLDQLVDGQTELVEGTETLAGGADQIADGTKTVNDGWDELEDNVAILHDGRSEERRVG